MSPLGSSTSQVPNNVVQFGAARGDANRGTKCRNDGAKGCCRKHKYQARSNCPEAQPVDYFPMIVKACICFVGYPMERCLVLVCCFCRCKCFVAGCTKRKAVLICLQVDGYSESISYFAPLWENNRRRVKLIT